MHPALIIALMEERERELARRNRHAWKRPANPRPERRVRPRATRVRRASAALARGLGFFS